MLEGFQAIDDALTHHEDPLTPEEEGEVRRMERGEKVAVELSNYVNLLLLFAKVRQLSRNFLQGSWGLLRNRPRNCREETRKVLRNHPQGP